MTMPTPGSPEAVALMIMQAEYPALVCIHCETKHGYRAVGYGPWHVDTCDLCGQVALVTAPKDFVL